MNPFEKLWKTTIARPAHLTHHATRVGSVVSSVGGYVKQRLWIWPIIAVLLLSVIGFSVRSAVESTMKQNLESQMQTLLNVETAMLETWFNVQKSNVESLANDRQIRESVGNLLQVKSSAEPTAVTSSPEDIARELAPGLASHEYSGFFVADKKGLIRASSYPTLIGQTDIRQFEAMLNTAAEGRTAISAPFRSVVMTKAAGGEMQIGHPSMYVCAPVRDADFQVVGVLALRIHPEKEFTRILQLGRIGDSGETYAFNRDGLMVSNSRFDEDLILLGLIADTEFSRSILQVQVRDPGGDVTEGFRPKLRRAELPLTRMASSAITDGGGVDVEGYRDYRGVPVVGAWSWLSEYDIGVATEVDFAEAFRPLTILQRTFWVLYALLVVSAIAIFAFTVVVARLQQEAQKAAIEAKQLGQYTLEEELGSGAMGVVYRGRHSMMRRPTAIKMLNPDAVTEASVERFEREVQLTCQLTHPNTIAIYDFGRTPEGVFYYAMEYLEGVDLEALVERYGAQPEDRVIHILTQICGSLFEAHSQGLVHRDIKPANIILTRRGEEPDVVKVLDFGLVKAVDEKKKAGLTTAGSLTGTPLYMSPESIQAPMSVDARSDIYAVGAVGYFLLTGGPVFDAENLVELCQKHVDEKPTPPSERIGRSMAPELEFTILACLEKDPAKRPQNARDLSRMISRAPSASQWTVDTYEDWWRRHALGQSVETSESNSRRPVDDSQQRRTSPNSSTSEYDRTIVTNTDSEDGEQFGKQA